MKDKILLFIPMYNCEKQITRVIKQINNEIISLIDEVLVVDNQSKDNSLNNAKLALQSLNNIKATLVQNKENYNLGGSHKVAFSYAMKNNYDYVIVFHGDDQGEILDLLPYLKNKEYRNYDSFLGSRFALKSKLVGYSKFRILGNYGVNALCSVATKSLVSDLGSGLNLYKTLYLKNKFYLHFPNNLTFNVYMLFYGIWKKSSFKFFPIHWKEEDQISNAKVFRQGLVIIKLAMTYVLYPKKIFSNQQNQYSQINYDYNLIYSNQ